MNFRDLGLDSRIADATDEMGWTEPTPVQEAVIPAGLSGRDIFAQAQTGTGKTGTYASIILGRIKSRSDLPSAIVLVPTRELANQIDIEIKKLAQFTKHRTLAVYGGASISDQIYKLKRGVDIVVGTPGRVKDMIIREALDLSMIKEAVLDEADRMLDMGFADELDFIMDAIPKERQTMLFSATMAKEIRSMATKVMEEPLEFLISKDEPCSDLTTQYYVQVSRSGKADRLQTIVRNGNPKVIVFCQTKKMVDDLYDMLHRDVKAEAIHGDMPQGKREKVMKSFRNDKFDVLIATDVVARGLDVNNVDCVVNYDVPADPETYLHRIGRTGRAGKEGIAISFVTKSEDQRIRMYEKATGKKIMKIRVEDLDPIERTRAPVAVVEEKPVRQKRENNPPKKTNGTKKKGTSMFMLQVNLGKNDGVGRMQISDLIRDRAEIPREMIGRIGLGKSSSFFEIDGDSAEYVIDAFSECKYAGKEIHMQMAPVKTSYPGNRKAKAY